MTPSKKTLSRLKETVYLNAIRLFCDSCILFKNRSYPSSYALAILSFEELGKLEMIDHICDDIQLGSDHKDMVSLLFSRNMYYSHKCKQAWSENDGWLFSKKTKRMQDILKGRFDRNKQDSFYVDYYKNRIRNPSRVSAAKSYTEITKVKKKIEQINDLGFNGFDCFSTDESCEKARRQINQVKIYYDNIDKPKRKTD